MNGFAETWIVGSVGVIGLLGCGFVTLPEMRKRTEARRAQQAACAHNWSMGRLSGGPGRLEYWYRTCSRCGKQEHLRECWHCGKRFNEVGQEVQSPEHSEHPTKRQGGEGGIPS